jgi:hypothetical protein
LLSTPKGDENGHLARPNGAIDGPYCSLTWPGVFGRRCEPLAGRGGGFWGGAAPAPTCGAWGASSIRVPKKNAWCPGLRGGLPAKAWPGWPSYVPCSCSREAQAGGTKPLLCHNPPEDVQEETLSCARDQVVLPADSQSQARPPVLTPPWRYRRSVLSKGRFAISINVICVGYPFKPSEKAISRGDRLFR